MNDFKLSYHFSLHQLTEYIRNMELACDCDAMGQIELTTRNSSAELEAQKRSIFSTQKPWSFVSWGNE